MKRIKYLAVLLLTVGVLGLTGCGSSSADVGVQESTEIADEPYFIGYKPHGRIYLYSPM